MNSERSTIAPGESDASGCSVEGVQRVYQLLKLTTNVRGCVPLVEALHREVFHHEILKRESFLTI